MIHAPNVQIVEYVGTSAIFPFLVSEIANNTDSRAICYHGLRRMEYNIAYHIEYGIKHAGNVVLNVPLT